MRAAVVCGLVGTLGLAGCGERTEGSEPGDCSDGADNDSDGTFDCRDTGCAGAPVCATTDAGTAGDSGTIGDSAISDTGLEVGDSGDAPDGGSGDAQPILDWAFRFGGENQARAQALVTDGSGNVVVVGSFRSSIEIGDEELTADDRGMYIVSFAPGGSYRWGTAFESTVPSRSVAPLDVGVDSAGNVYVVGSFGGSVDFGGGPLQAADSADVFVLSLTEGGDYRWSTSFGGSGGDIARSVAISPSGDSYVTGSFHDVVDVGGVSLEAVGNVDIFLASLDASGTHRWAQAFGNSGNDEGLQIAVRGDASVFLGGSFVGTIDLGGQELESPDVGSNFIAEFSPAGTHRWSRIVGVGGVVSIRGLDANDTGLLVSGDFGGSSVGAADAPGTVDFGTGPIRSMGNRDPFVLRLDSAGATEWVRAIGGPNRELGAFAAFDSSGDLVSAGEVDVATDFGAGAVVGSGVFLAGYSSAGDYEWADVFDVPSISDMSTTVEGGVVILGAFGDVADFGGGPLVVVGDDELYLAKFSH